MYIINSIDSERYEGSFVCDKAFEKIKHLFVPAILHLPNMEKQFLDASEMGFVARLEQEGPDNERYQVAYTNWRTNNAEVKYAQTELELTALVYV